MEWATDPRAPADNLVLYIVDHGGFDEFRLNEHQTLDATTLDRWLDTLQATLPGNLFVIYDACQSGTFVDDLLPPNGKQRVVMTSASNQPAYFTEGGRVSFSYQFWSAIQRGARVLPAYDDAKRTLLGTLNGRQTPVFDTNGDGVEGPQDSLKGLQIGRGFVSANDNPTIGSVPPPFETHVHSAELFVDGIVDTTGVSRVWAIVRPPGVIEGPLDEPVLTVPTLELNDDDGDNRWTGTYEGFRQEGVYEVAFYAINSEGGLSVSGEMDANRTTVTRIGSDPNQPPALSLMGAPRLALLTDQLFIDEGAIATDVEDGDLSADISIQGRVATSQPGRYDLVYSVTDSEGLTSRATRTVIVTDVAFSAALDSDRDGIADDSDPDDDNDMVPDVLDPFPLDAAQRADSDGDGIGDVYDNDDDGDGVPDLARIIHERAD